MTTFAEGKEGVVAYLEQETQKSPPQPETTARWETTLERLSRSLQGAA